MQFILNPIFSDYKCSSYWIPYSPIINAVHTESHILRLYMQFILNPIFSGYICSSYWIPYSPIIYAVHTDNHRYSQSSRVNHPGCYKRIFQQSSSYWIITAIPSPNRGILFLYSMYNLFMYWESEKSSLVQYTGTVQYYKCCNKIPIVIVGH